MFPQRLQHAPKGGICSYCGSDVETGDMKHYSFTYVGYSRCRKRYKTDKNGCNDWNSEYDNEEDRP